jgi:segregation and condensation protein A
MFELTFDYYKGPIEKLLELIEERKLEVTIVNLAKVTESFFEYLEKLEKENIKKEIIADFLVVASKLLLIKSKVLLPSLSLSQEEEEEIKDLELRIKLYQEFKGAKNHIRSMWNESPVMFSREFLKGFAGTFYPPSNVNANSLLENVKKVVVEVEKIFKPFVKIKGEFINLKHKIEEVLKRLNETPQSFRNLHKGEKKEIIILFLAILHLIKQELIEVRQEYIFGDILINKSHSQ